MCRSMGLHGVWDLWCACMQVLLEAGAPLDVINQRGATPIDLASSQAAYPVSLSLLQPDQPCNNPTLCPCRILGILVHSILI